MSEPDAIAKLSGHFREQAGYCDEYGSPFTARLMEAMAADLDAGGPVRDLVGAWRTNPRADALALRLAGALHAAVLTGRDPALAALYPKARDDWRMDDVWPAARAFLKREHDWVAGFITSPPQTNETRRAIILLAAFLTFGAEWCGPIDVLELGASAGLNLNWDRFRYATKDWSWGNETSPVLIETAWSAPAPPLVDLNVRARAACDRNPLDLSDRESVLRLRSYIWPDQPERLARFDGAVALALAAGTNVDRADAAGWIQDKLAHRAKDAATIVYHSVFLQYPPPETRAAIVAAIEKAGAEATADAPLVWVRLEAEDLLAGTQNSPNFVCDLITWPGGTRRVIGYCDGHVRSVRVG